MTYDPADLEGQTIFVDANAILYHLQGLSPTAKEVFLLAEQKKLELITTTRIIDEVIHKLLLIKAREKYGFTRKTIEKLRKDKAKVKLLAGNIDILFAFTKTIHLRIKTITNNDLRKLPKIMKSYGLLGSDSLIVMAMRKFKTQFLLTSDGDFENIEWVKVIPVLPANQQAST
jgi:predicted nucleic acid-binding protein